MKRFIFRTVVISITVSALVLVLNSLGVFQRLENILYDSRMVHTASYNRPSDEIAVILVDQDSIDWANQELGWSWPWERKAYGQIVDFFNLGNAAAVTFDVLFTEPSVYGPEDDATFAQFCSDYGRVVQTVFFDQQHGNKTEWKESAPLPPVSFGNEFGTEPMLFPIDEISKTTAVLGSITSTSDSDKTIRRASAYRKYGSYYIPTLGLAPLFAAGEETPDPLIEPKEGRYLRFQNSLENYVPYSAGQILQSYYAIQEGKEPLLEPKMFEDMYVFFGFYAPGLFDICSTPISATYPGVGVHITFLDNYLQDSFLKPSPFFVLVILVLISAILGSVPISVAEMFRIKHFNVFIATLCFLFICVFFVGIGYTSFAMGNIIPMVSPLSSLVLSFIVAVIVSYRQEGRQRRYIKAAFKQYLSPAVIDDLISHPERLSLGGTRRRISIYFSDVQGFTGISENLAPEELTALLNDYLSAMTDIILESGGTIDKYEGDAIIAFWNAPVEQSDHSRRALEAAVACQKKLDEIRHDLEVRAKKTFKMRIGINTGDAVVGNMGSRSRFDYTMLGDAVNLASRLEGLNKEFGTYCMCSHSTKQEAEACGIKLKFRELARATVVGKKEPVVVYEPMSLDEYEKRQQILREFDKGLRYFYSGNFQQAKDIFYALQTQDEVSSRYYLKCKELLNSPPNMESWKGIWIASSK